MISLERDINIVTHLLTRGVANLGGTLLIFSNRHDEDFLTETAGRLRNDKRFDALRLMVYAPSGSKGDASHFHTAGFDAYLSKPLVDEQLLFDTLDEQLQRNGS